MSLLGGHLGSRASALLDGQLSDEDTERCWSHVAECDVCHDLVQREGWLKRRLAGLGCDPGASAPDRLKGALLCGGSQEPPGGLAAADGGLVVGLSSARQRRALAFAALGGGAVGAAMMGILAVGAGPAAAPTFHRHTPVTTVDPGASTVAVVHVAHRAGGR